MSDSLPLGLLTAEQILNSIILPPNVGKEYGSFRVRVYDRGSRRAIGLVIWDKDRGASFKRTVDEQPHNVTAEVTVLEGQYLLGIHVTSLEEPTIYATARAILGDQSEEALPLDALVTWYVRVEHSNGTVTEVTHHRASPENFPLVDFPWLSGRMIINVNYLNRVGALILYKAGEDDLSNLILVAELEGLFIPDDFYDNIVW